MSTALSLLKDCLITRVSNSASAATTAINSTILDMQGYDNVLFIVALGDITATCVLTATAYDNSANSTSGAATTGVSTTFTAGASDADNLLMIVDVRRPQDRYCYLNLTRTTANAVVDGIIAIQYNGNKFPVTQGATVLGSSFGQGA
mgnify:CR=1 FL=1